MNTRTRKNEPLESLWTHWSITKLSMWLTCNLQFWFGYGLHLPNPPDMQRLLGEALHEMYNNFFAKNYKSQETFVGSWKTQWWHLTKKNLEQEFGITDWPDPSSAGTFFGRGTKLLKLFYDANIRFKQEGLIPLTEQAITWPIGLIEFEARIDRLQPVAGISDRYTIYDYKTGWRQLAEAELIRNYQLTAYQLAHRHKFGTDPLGLEIHYTNRLLAEAKPEGKVVSHQNQFGLPWPWLVKTAPLRNQREFDILITQLHAARMQVKAVVAQLSSLDKTYLQPPAVQTAEFQQAVTQAGFMPRHGRHCTFCPFENACRNYTPPVHPDPQYYQDEMARARQVRAAEKAKALAKTPSIVFPRRKPKRRPKSLPAAAPRPRKKKGFDKTPDLFLPDPSG